MRRLDDTPAEQEADAAHVEGTGHDVAPDVEVGGGVGVDDRLARRAARHVHLHDLSAVDGEQSVGVDVAQVALAGHRQAGRA